MEKLIAQIKRILNSKTFAVIAIDGPCASGKTTLALKLSKEFPSQIIHTDDFFLPPDMRSEERLSQAGGNIHFERFIEEVVNPIKSGKGFKYRIFDCKESEYTEKKKVALSGLIIVEGSYSLREDFEEIYDLRVFVEADYGIRFERILQRNGEEKLKIFKEKWIPLEDAYFEAFGIKDKCDIIIKK